MNLASLSIDELQSLATAGPDIEVLSELGRRVVDLDFCFDDIEGTEYCEHQHELHKLEFELLNELPPECPHCGKWLDMDKTAGQDSSPDSLFDKLERVEQCQRYDVIEGRTVPVVTGKYMLASEIAEALEDKSND